MINPSLKNRLLVIDDELGPRESLRMLLKNICKVTCAVSAKEGLRLLQEIKPDLVILDLRMPDLDGIETLRQIRAMDANVAVIILTGYASVETAQEAVRLWACDYLKKPFDAREMMEVVERNFKKTAVARRRSQVLKDFKDLNQRLMNALVKKDHQASFGEKAVEISHNLQTSLAVAMTATRLLFKRLETPPNTESQPLQETLRALDVIEESVQHCCELIVVLQSLNKPSAQSSAPIAIKIILAECIEAVKPVAASAWLSVEFEISEDECLVLADPVQIFHAVHQIMLTTIQLAAGTAQTLRVVALRKESNIEIRLIVNGCTLNDVELGQLLNPPLAMSRTAKGWTFSVARKLVEAHGGCIMANRTAGQDLVLVIRLPLFQEPASPKPDPSKLETVNCSPDLPS